MTASINVAREAGATIRKAFVVGKSGGMTPATDPVRVAQYRAG